MLMRANEKIEYSQVPLGFNESQSAGQRGNAPHCTGFSLAAMCHRFKTRSQFFCGMELKDSFA